MIDWSKFDWVLLSPELIIFGTAILVIVLDLILPKGKGISGWLTIIGLLAGLSSTFTLRQGELFGGMLILDRLAIFSKQLLLAITIVVTLSSLDYVKKLPANKGEYYCLLLLAVQQS